jgi:uncharacterized phage protein (TIGR02216 family)
MSPFPWPEAMRFGFGVMRLSSRDFWSLTPRELAAAFEATNGRSRGAAIRPDDFSALMARFPDEVKREVRHG